MNAPIEPTANYLSNTTYAQLKAALTRLVADPFEREGTDAETEVVRTLGEVGGVWPEFVRDDALA
ncbi:hypothetical protein [Roseovarius indicus]|uniref:hypothetical protein n=1 Tax=Roseovarius indicus TaxID=540747 RepID=UPI0007DA1542|nr:hypothetical protein [Roseovarius indicus]OAO03213.1 hypothetical protein A8B76_08360 [Roseovarius indicus]